MNFSEFIKPAIGLPIAHAWRGHGSTIFLELGQLQVGRTRRDGSIGNAIGQTTIHVGPSWRVEGKRSILCGSDDGKRAIDKQIQRLIGNSIVEISTTGRLQELQLILVDHVLTTYTLSKGQPHWDIGHVKSGIYMYSKFGKIKFEGPRT